MYEPYGEEKKSFNLKEKFNRLKEKVQEKFKNVNLKGINTENLKSDKVTITAIALSLLFIIGSITGYVSYTGKFNTIKTENEVLKRQKDACQTELENANRGLLTCSNDLETVRSDLTRMTLDYQTSQADFQTCNEERLTLSSDLNLVNEERKKLQSNYDKLKSEYSDLEDDLENIECHYAKERCRNYYFIKDDEVFCCVKNDPEYCDDDPGSLEIKEITC